MRKKTICPCDKCQKKPNCPDRCYWKFCADETYDALTALHEKLEEWKARALKAEDKLQKITDLAEGWREAHAE